jgi:hypothetical protein
MEGKLLDSLSGFQPHAEESACRLQEPFVVDWAKVHEKTKGMRPTGAKQQVTSTVKVSCLRKKEHMLPTKETST